MNIVVRGVSEMQMNVVSIERCEEYTHLPPEVGFIPSCIFHNKSSYLKDK